MYFKRLNKTTEIVETMRTKIQLERLQNTVLGVCVCEGGQ